MKGGLFGFGHWGRILAKTFLETAPQPSLKVFDPSKEAFQKSSSGEKGGFKLAKFVQSGRGGKRSGGWII